MDCQDPGWALKASAMKALGDLVASSAANRERLRGSAPLKAVLRPLILGGLGLGRFEGAGAPEFRLNSPATPGERSGRSALHARAANPASTEARDRRRGRSFSQQR